MFPCLTKHVEKQSCFGASCRHCAKQHLRFEHDVHFSAEDFLLDTKLRSLLAGRILHFNKFEVCLQKKAEHAVFSSGKNTFAVMRKRILVEWKNRTS